MLRKNPAPAGFFFGDERLPLTFVVLASSMGFIGQRAAVRLRKFAIGLRVAGDSAIGDRRWFIALRIAALPQSLIRARKSHLILGLCRIANLTAGARHVWSNPKCLARILSENGKRKTENGKRKTENGKRKPLDMDTIWASKRCYPPGCAQHSKVCSEPDGRAELWIGV